MGTWIYGLQLIEYHCLSSFAIGTNSARPRQAFDPATVFCYKEIDSPVRMGVLLHGDCYFAFVGTAAMILQSQNSF